MTERLEKDIDARVTLSIAFDRYANAESEQRSVEKRFEHARKKLHELLEPNMKVVIRSSGRHYLLQTNTDGDFHCEPIVSV